MMNWGTTWKLENKVTVSSRLTLRDEWISSKKITIPAGDGFKLTYSDKCDAKKLLSPKDFWYKCGVAVEFKL